MAEKRTRRKTTQIAVTSEGGGNDHLFMLTDDGVVWMMKENPDTHELYWQEIPGPPDRVETFDYAHPRPRSR